MGALPKILVSRVLSPYTPYLPFSFQNMDPPLLLNRKWSRRGVGRRSYDIVCRRVARRRTVLTHDQEATDETAVSHMRRFAQS